MHSIKNKVTLLIGVVFSGLFPITPATADSPQGYTFLPYDKGIAESRRTGKKIFLYYGRQGCGFCDKTNKESFSDAAVKKAYIEKFVLVYLDSEGSRRLKLPTGERITEMQFGARLNTIGTPVFMFLEPDGKRILRAPGFQTAKDFLNMGKYIEGDHYKSKTLSQYIESKLK